MPDKRYELANKLVDAAFRVLYRALVIEPTEAGAAAAQIAAGRERFGQIAAEYLGPCYGTNAVPHLTAILIETLDRDWARARAGDATPPSLLIRTYYSHSFPASQA